jgi:hypothetical protein
VPAASVAVGERQIDQPAKQVRRNPDRHRRTKRGSPFSPNATPISTQSSPLKMTAGQGQQTGAFFERHVPQNVIGKVIHGAEKRAEAVAWPASNRSSVACRASTIDASRTCCSPQLRDQCVRSPGAQLQPGEQKGFFLGVMQLLRKLIQVEHDRAQQAKVWWSSRGGIPDQIRSPCTTAASDRCSS